MAANDFLFTSKSVSEGHPDKVCDRISDEVVDLYLREYPFARVACETLATTNRVVIAGEVRPGPGSRITPELIAHTARMAIKDIGYEQDGFHWHNADVDVLLHEQSADIAMGVDAGAQKDEGAGDQGIMFGYATDETAAMMPAPIQYAHELLRRLAADRHSGELAQLGPDAKSQFTLRYVDGRPVGASSVVLSTQHVDGHSPDDIKELVRPYVVATLPEGWMCPEADFYVNPTGKFVIGGPDGDAGLTGRKIIVDTYGGAAPHGGGAFSGKDPTKVDRSAAYAARYLAKNVVAAGTRPSLRDPALLRHRRLQAIVDLCRHLWHRSGRRAAARQDPERDHEPQPARHPRASAAQPADLCPNLGLRPFRPRSRYRWRVLLGAHRPRRRAPPRLQLRR